MGHKVSRHKSYAVCRVDGLPGQYRVIQQNESYGSQPNSNARSYVNGGHYQSHDPGVTADRKYVTAINDIGSQGIRSHRAESKPNEVISAKSKPKPKPRKRKDINSNEKTNGDLPKQQQPPYPAKRKDSPKKEKDPVVRKSNGSAIHANATLNQGNTLSGNNLQGNGTVVQERPQRVVPRAIPPGGDECKQRVVPRANPSGGDECKQRIVPCANPPGGDECKQRVVPRGNSTSAGERKQRTIPRANFTEDDARQQAIHSYQHQPLSATYVIDTKSLDDEPIPVSNVDSPEMNTPHEKSYHDVEIPHTSISVDLSATKTCNDPQMITSHIIDNTTTRNNITASDSVVTDSDNSHHTLVSVVVHQPFTKPEPINIPKVVLNGDQECLSDQEKIEQEGQIMLDDEPVNVAMFERANSARSSQIKKSVAFSDECVDIEQDLSRSYSRNGFHEKMDNVYGTTVKQNDGDKWVTLDASDATDFALIQRQKVPGQSILKKSKYPPSDIPPLDLKESFNRSSEFKTISNNKKSDVDWDHIEYPSNPYPHGMVPVSHSNPYSQGMVPVPAPRVRVKAYHRPQNEEMSRIKASNGTLADYIKQKSVNSYQATKPLNLNTTSNGVNHSIVIQNGGPRPHSSRGHGGDMSPRYMTSPRSSSADPRSRALSPDRVDTRGRIVMHDGHARKVVNAYGVDPAVHYYGHSPRGKDTTTLDHRSTHRQAYPPQQNVKLVISSGKQKPTKKKQHKQIMEQPKQHRNMIRQQWMVGNL